MDISRVFLHDGCGNVYGNVCPVVRLNGMIIDIEKALFLLLEAQAGVAAQTTTQRVAVSRLPLMRERVK